MDTQTVQAMQNAAQPGTHKVPVQPGTPPVQNHNGTTTPSHIPPAEATQAASKKLASALLFSPTEQPSAAPTDVNAIQEAIKQQTNNKELIAERVRAKLGIQTPSNESPQTVANPLSETTGTIINASKEEKQEPIVSTLEDQDSEFPVSSDEEKNPASENFKKLRSAFSQSKKTAKELLEQKTNLETKVKQYEAGEIETEVTKKLKERVQQLEPLAQLVDLKTSEAYNEKFVKPLTDISTELKTIAKDYNVPDNVIEHASKLTNRKELNEFLVDHFGEAGLLEVKPLISKMQGIRQELSAAEAAPQQALEKITQDHLRLREQKELGRRAQISETGKGSWASALLSIRQSGKYPEFTPRENDLTFNTTWVEPLTNKAAEEYGSLVSHLGQNGLEKLDPEFGKGLASMAVRAIGYDTAVARANALEKELHELQENTKRINSMVRPGIGTSRGSVSGAPQESKPTSPQGAARALLGHVGVKI